MANEKELCHVTTRAMSADSDEDCVELVGPQTPMGRSGQITTRSAARFGCDSSHSGDGSPRTKTDDEDCSGTNTTSAIKNCAVMENTPGTSGHDAEGDARSDSNPAPGCCDEDYVSYVTVVATISDESSDDEELNKAITASLESYL